MFGEGEFDRKEEAFGMFQEKTSGSVVEKSENKGGCCGTRWRQNKAKKNLAMSDRAQSLQIDSAQESLWQMQRRQPRLLYG